MSPADSLLNASLPPSVRSGRGAGGLDRLTITTAAATAEIYLHGAHVTSWQPSSERGSILWMSAESLFAPGKPIRGGVPICFPWFGAHQSDAAAPAHGFARTLPWNLVGADERGDSVIVTLELTVTRTPLWPHDAVVQYHVSVGRQLGLRLEVTNTGTSPLSFEEALHTYFAVSDIREVEVRGLENTNYLDKVAGFDRRLQGADPIRFAGETDRIYLDRGEACSIDDRPRGRAIRLAKQHSASTVVWNPWIARAEAMPDFGDGEWTEMLCVETGNVRLDPVSLGPGESHVMSAEISIGS